MRLQDPWFYVAFFASGPLIGFGCQRAVAPLPSTTDFLAASAAPSSRSVPSPQPRSLHASPAYQKAEHRFARGDYRGALALIDKLLAESSRTGTDQNFLKHQREICKRALRGKSSASSKTAFSEVPGATAYEASIPNRSCPQGRQSRSAAPILSGSTPTPLGKTETQNQDCGPKALLYVCRHYKIPATLREVQELCLTPTAGGSIANPKSKIKNPPQGTTFAQLARAAKRKGLAAEGLKVDWSYLKRMPKPVIAWVRSNHYVVVLQTRWGRVHYYDPATDPLRNPQSQIRNGRAEVMTSKDFGEIWQGYVLALRTTDHRTSDHGTTDHRTTDH